METLRSPRIGRKREYAARKTGIQPLYGAAGPIPDSFAVAPAWGKFQGSLGETRVRPPLRNVHLRPYPNLQMSPQLVNERKPLRNLG